VRWIAYVAVLILLGACQNIGEDVPGTISAAEMSLVTEAAVLEDTAATRAVEAMATVAVDETRIAGLQSINDQLLLTLAAGSTPTPALIVGQADVRQADLMGEDGNLNRLFTQSGIGTEVSAADGCVLDPAFTFSSDTIEVLYATGLVRNATGSIAMRVEWYWNNQIVHESNFQMTPDRSPFCFWFPIDRGNTDFAPGNWTVRMYADEFPLRDLTMSFEITE